jgi:hypothetical protein
MRLAAALVAVALAFAGCSGGGPKAVEVSKASDLAGLQGEVHPVGPMPVAR